MNQLSATMTSDRFLRIPGSINFRDFGGYVTKEGRRIKTGKLFRCGSMVEIVGPGEEQFAALDVGVICDMRRDDEVEMAPTPSTEVFACRVHIPIAPGSSPDLRDSITNPDHSFEDRVQYMTEITREIARDHVEAYQQVFTHLLETPNGFLIHCSAGKDRTGFGAAMIKLALGVSEADVMADYLMSNESSELLDRMIPRMEEQGLKLDMETYRVLAGVREEYLLGALDEIHNHFGGIDGYLEATGLGPGEREELRQRLLD